MSESGKHQEIVSKHMLDAKHKSAYIMHMNKLPTSKRVQILSMLCEGSSMRSISRVCDVSINTVAKLLEEAGKFCMAFHDEKVRSVQSKRVQMDEIWSFTAAKQKNVAAMKKGNYILDVGREQSDTSPRQGGNGATPDAEGRRG